jgi:hypothetical protein
MTKGTECGKLFDVARVLGVCCTGTMVAMKSYVLEKKESTIEHCWLDVPGREEPCGQIRAARCYRR